MKVFIDSNIPMYASGADHPNRQAALRFLERVENGEIEAATSVEVLQEILYRYSSLGRKDEAREVYDLFVEVCPAVFPVTLADTDLARDLLLSTEGISARDAVHASVALNNGITVIATFDKGFDGIDGVKRFRLR